MQGRVFRPIAIVVLACALLGTRAGADLQRELKSPVMEEPARWTLFAGSALTVMVLAAGPNSFVSKFEDDSNKNKPLGQYSKYGDLMGQLVPNALYAGGMAVAQWAGYGQGYSSMWLMVSATAYSGAVTTALKYTIREGRPYNSRVRDSFPSGHSSTAFAFAGVVAAEHGWLYGVPAMALAGFVGFSRINDHKHYLKDVVAGATVGLTCALGVYYARQEERGEVRGPQILPQPLPDGMEVAAVWRF